MKNSFGLSIFSLINVSLNRVILRLQYLTDGGGNGGDSCGGNGGGSCGGN